MNRRFALAAALVSLIAAGALFAENTVLINAAGATFPYPVYSKWFDVYHTKNPNIQINYASVGSGAGISQLLNGTVDFGASDVPMTDEQLAQAKIKLLHFPTVLGADVPTYNVPGVSTDLNFTQKALAGIYLGTITKWNDGEIANANQGDSMQAARKNCAYTRNHNYRNVQYPYQHKVYPDYLQIVKGEENKKKRNREKKKKEV